MLDELRWWVMRQTWRDLLFAHWPIPPAAMRALIPEPLELDIRDGAAWIAVVPFEMTGIRGRFLPPLPALSRALELNVRTYVRYGGRSGVYFFSLDANSRVLVRGARITYKLPYMDARMSWDGRLYTSLRSGRGAAFRASYAPIGDPFIAAPHSLESFLTDRYSLFAVHQRRVFRADITHAPWSLQPATAEIEQNTMAAPLGLTLSETPLLHFSRRLDVRIGPSFRL